MTIDIPVEAREKMLQMTRKSIFEQGKGIDPDPQNFGNSSGTALKYLYSLLELKAGMAEMEFRVGLKNSSKRYAITAVSLVKMSRRRGQGQAFQTTPNLRI